MNGGRKSKRNVEKSGRRETNSKNFPGYKGFGSQDNSRTGRDLGAL